MREVVIEHVSIEELPAAWRAKLSGPGDVRVTVRIEPEWPAGRATSAAESVDPAFGIWRDRQDMSDVATYLRRLRAPRGVSSDPEAPSGDAA